MKDPDISGLIKKASESLEAARLLLKSGYTDFSASRSYYAMFYTAQALLLTKNLAFSKHSAVISALSKEFIKSGLLPQTLHRYILKAFDTRHKADYGSIGSVNKETAAVLIDQAEEFIKTITEYLKNKGFEL